MRARYFRQRGLSLIELMIALALGMGVALAAAALIGAARTSYLAVNDNAQVQETGRYALELIARAIREANHVPHDRAAFADADFSAWSPGVAKPSQQDKSGNDVLTLGYLGSGPKSKADGSILNCAGFAVAEPADAKDDNRDWSTFYVAADGTGEPELRCEFVARKGVNDSIAVARGVEALRVLYGIAEGSDGAVTQYRPAAQMSAQQWSRVATVKVALLVRGETIAESGTGSPALHVLLGNALTGLRQPRRLRKVFQTTVRLRNLPPA